MKRLPLPLLCILALVPPHAAAQFKNPIEQFALIAESRLENDDLRYKCRELNRVELDNLVRVQPASRQMASGNFSFFCQPYVRATGSDEGLENEASIVFVTREGAVLPFIFKP